MKFIVSYFILFFSFIAFGQVLPNDCETGNIKACMSLGNQFADSNSLKAKLFYKKACNLGGMLGCRNLGALERKDGNDLKAKEFYIKACEGGLAEVCMGLAGLFEQAGQTKLTKYFFKKACTYGNEKGCKELAKLGESSSSSEAAQEITVKSKNSQPDEFNDFDSNQEVKKPNKEELTLDDSDSKIEVSQPDEFNDFDSNQEVKKPNKEELTLDDSDSFNFEDKDPSKDKELSKETNKTASPGTIKKKYKKRKRVQKKKVAKKKIKKIKKIKKEATSLPALVTSSKGDSSSEVEDTKCTGDQCLTLAFAEESKNNLKKAMRFFQKACYLGKQKGCDKWEAIREVIASASVPKKEEDLGALKKENSLSDKIVPIVLMGLGGLLTIVVLIFIANYFRKQKVNKDLF